MSFSADWLALREPADLAARDSGLLSRAADAAGRDAIVLDLGSGTGSTARAFSDATAATWTWRFVDGDAELLDIARARHPGADPVVMNLRDIDALPLEGVALVTASALLDLMPEAWVERLAKRLRAAGVPFYAALNYDGVMHWSPARTDDTAMTEAFNAHQQTDKGIGAAMGPASATRTAQIFTQCGFEVTLADSPWVLGADHAALHQELVVGIGGAAQEVGASGTDIWIKSRTDDAPQTTATIGHTDLLALPRGTH